MRTFDFDAEYGAAYERTARQMAPARDTSYLLVALLLRHALPERAKVLVVGTGTGKELAHLAEVGADWSFTGVETAAQMVQLTQEKMRQSGMEARAEVHEGPIEVLPREQVFDAATLLYVLHFADDDAKRLSMLQELAARLKPGGLLVVGQHQAIDEARYSMLFQAAWEEFMDRQGMTAEAKATFLERCRTGLHPITDDGLISLLTRAGFERPQPFFRALFQAFWLTRTRPDGGEV